MKLSPAGAGAWSVSVRPSAEGMPVTTAEPIVTVLAVGLKPLPRIVTTSPGRDQIVRVYE